MGRERKFAAVHVEVSVVENDGVPGLQSAEGWQPVSIAPEKKRQSTGNDGGDENTMLKEAPEAIAHESRQKQDNEASGKCDRHQRSERSAASQDDGFTAVHRAVGQQQGLHPGTMAARQPCDKEQVSVFAMTGLGETKSGLPRVRRL